MLFQISKKTSFISFTCYHLNSVIFAGEEIYQNTQASRNLSFDEVKLLRFDVLYCKNGAQSNSNSNEQGYPFTKEIQW